MTIQEEAITELRVPETPPSLDGLAVSAVQALEHFERVRAVRAGEFVNIEGGDVGGGGNRRSLLRHTANYLAAGSLARPGGLFVDVGGGVGAFAVWLAERLGAAPHLVDADPDVRRVAAAAFPHATVHDGLDGPPAGAATTVTAMEVVEHVAYADQVSFVRGLRRLVAPGGLLVVSTPDETGYVGGWSGYAPHVGVLDAEGLRELLRAGTGLPASVWRLEGEPFRLGRVERAVGPLANRAWASLTQGVPHLARRLASVAGALSGRLHGLSGPRQRELSGTAEARAVPPAEGHGTGLLGVVHVPG